MPDLRELAILSPSSPNILFHSLLRTSPILQGKRHRAVLQAHHLPRKVPDDLNGGKRSAVGCAAVETRANVGRLSASFQPTFPRAFALPISSSSTCMTLDRSLQNPAPSPKDKQDWKAYRSLPLS